MAADMEDAPRLHSNSQTLSLSFTSSLIQSSMRLDAPDELVLDYTRAMMVSLLLNPAPRRVLMIGLGGGSMLKYLHRHLPEAEFTVVEISQAVIDLRHDFLVPPDSARLQTVCDDGARFMRTFVQAFTQQAAPAAQESAHEAPPPARLDLILVDGFDGSGLPPALSSRRFYEDCREALTDDGVLVANVQADTARSREIRQRLSRAFGGAIASVESEEGGNEVITAASAQMLAACRTEFEARWHALAPAHQATLAATSSRFQRALAKGLPLG